MTTIVIDLTSHQWLALIAAFLMGGAFTWLFFVPWAVLRSSERANAQWFAQSERDHQARKQFIKI